MRALTGPAERVLRATGTPAFLPLQANPFGLTDVGDESKPALADLDGDGDLDVLSGTGAGAFVYFENTAGAGNTPAFDPAQTNPFGLTSIGNRSAPSVADLDGDGDLDVLSGTAYGTFVYFENTAGAGDPPAFTRDASTAPFGLTDVGFRSVPSVADFDGDGDPDVLTGRSDGDFVYFENTAGAGNTPAFTPNLSATPFGLTSVGTYGSRSTPNVADLDGDGDLDVIAGNITGDLVVFDNTAGVGATPAFGATQTNPFGLTNVGGSYAYAAPSVADLDGDGDLDVLVGRADGTFAYFEVGSGDAAVAKFKAPVVDAFGLTDIGTYSSPKLTDLDGDGDLDVLAGNNGSNSFSYFENTGTAAAPAFGPEQINPFGLTNIGRFIRPGVGDFDDDGDLDVLAGDSVGDLTYFENTGTATAPAFGTAEVNQFGLTNIGRFSGPELVDLDGDGDLDVLAGRYDGTFVYYQNIGTATQRGFGSRQTNPFGLTGVGPGTYFSPSVADLDGDGDFDVLAANRTNSFFYYENIGTPTAPAFAARLTNPFGLALASGRTASPGRAWATSTPTATSTC